MESYGVDKLSGNDLNISGCVAAAQHKRNKSRDYFIGSNPKKKARIK